MFSKNDKSIAPGDFLLSKGIDHRARGTELEVKVCPSCDGDTSKSDNQNKLRVNASHGAFHCHRCSAKGSFTELQRMFGETIPRGIRQALPVSSPGGNCSSAGKIWKQGLPLDHPGAEVGRQYFQSRGLQIPESTNEIRFHPSLYHPESKRLHPGLVLRVTGAGKQTAIHRIYLDSTGQKTSFEKNKLRLGSIPNSAIRFDNPSHSIHVAEGPETALAVREGIGKPTWATISAGGMETLKVPESVSEVTIWADLDKRNRGQAAAEKLRARLETEGKVARILLPPGPIPDGCKGVDWLDILVNRGAAALRTAYANANERPVEDAKRGSEWGSIVSLNEFQLSVFPTDVFPSWVQEYVTALSQYTETPIELPSLIALSILSTCTARIYRIQIKPRYSEPLNLWLCPALESGNRKTEVLSRLIEPLLVWERREHQRLAPLVQDAKSRRKSEESLINSLRTQLGKPKADREGLIAEIADMESKLTEIPTAPILWTSDITPEALGVLLSENSERIAFLSDEGGVFDLLAGRYSGGIPNLDLFLKSHAGSSDRVERMKRKVILESPALTIGICPQPSVLAGLSGMPAFRGRGLLARFLFALPRSPLGSRTGISVPIPESVSEGYQRGISELLRFQPAKSDDGTIEGRTIKLSPEALDAWQDFWSEIEQKLKPNQGALAPISDWGGKLPGAAARIAGILHVAENPNTPAETALTVGTMCNALRIADALTSHALATFGIMGEDKVVGDAKHILSWIQRERNDRFTRRDCHHALQSRFPKVEPLEIALAILEERFYVRPAPQKSVPHRPSLTYEVNPEIASQWIR